MKKQNIQDTTSLKKVDTQSICINFHKSSLCRLYLRGLCDVQKQKCNYAHGIDDLVYKSRQFNETIHLQFTGNCCQFYQSVGSMNQKNKNYINLHLYFCQNKQELIKSIPNLPAELTLEQLNENRQFKRKIRSQLHKKQFSKFMALMEKYNYQEKEYFQVEFIKQQYYRVGFNKLMTRIKFGHLDQYLSNGLNGYFKYNTCLVPQAPSRRKILYLKKAQFFQICQQYKKLSLDYLQNEASQQKLETSEQAMRQHVLLTPRNWKHIPPINQFLNEIKMSLTELIFKNQYFSELKQLLEAGKLPQIKSQQEIIEKFIVQTVKQKIKGNGFCMVQQEIYEALMRLKFNNKNQIKKILNKCVNSYKHYVKIMKLPLIGEIIIKIQSLEPKFMDKLEQQSSEYQQLLQIQYQERIKCQKIKEQNMQCEQLVDNDQLIFMKNSIQGSVYKYRQSYQIYLVSDGKQLLQHYLLFKKQQMIAIDLQGNLHSNQSGHIALIQLFLPSSKKAIVIDVWTIQKQKNMNSIKILNNMVKWLLSCKRIIKIFHDCRGDLNALLYLLPKEGPSMNLSEINCIFDTSIADIIIQQIKHNKSKQSNSPSLNSVLERYSKEDKKNHLKQKIHKIWEAGQKDPASSRPLSTQFLEYCVLDVLGLVQVYENMIGLISGQLLLQICRKSIEQYFNKKSQ